MRKNKIYFRADGNVVAGFGHVVRLMSMVSMLNKNYDCIFIIQSPDDFLRRQIKKVCKTIIELPATDTYEKEAVFISKNIISEKDFVVLDGYHFNTSYQQIIKERCFKLISIDDLQTFGYVADAVINHSEGIKAKNFSKQKYTQLFLGLKYALIRKSFLSNKIELKHSQSNHKAFINLGGTDQQNYTLQALQTCLTNSSINSIDVVVGSYYVHLDALKKIISGRKNIKINLHSNLTELKMCRLMKNSTVAICSASTVSYEYACVGGILFVIKTVANQKNIFSFLIQAKIAFDYKEFGKRLIELEKPRERKRYMENRLQYFSGNSSANILKIFRSFDNEREIIIRRASIKDLKIFFEWANDKEVRGNAINTSIIKYDSHKIWFAEKLKSKNSLLLVAERFGKKIGQVRFDKNKNKMVVDYSVAKLHRGKGYGEVMLKNAIRYLFQNNLSCDVWASVKISNIVSNIVFEKLGFKKIKSTIIKGVVYNNYQLKHSEFIFSNQ